MVVAYIICAPALFMPYRMRILYINAFSYLLHAPFKLFGKLARFLLNQLNIVEYDRGGSAIALSPMIRPVSRQPGSRVAILYSGGTDSTCAAAVLAERFETIHLLTFYEHATRHSPVPTKNVQLLRKYFAGVTFTHTVLSVDALVRYFWYERFAQTLRFHGFLSLSTPGYSSLSWHVRTIHFCLENGITHVADGLTRELMHFPGHVDEVVNMLRVLYQRYGISYENPVRDWQTPPDHQFIDQVLINRHTSEFVLGDTSSAQRKTTGQYLFDIGIFPHPNLKGTATDFSMQHDCYPFALYNLLAFWGHLTREPYPVFTKKISNLMAFKIEAAHALLDSYRSENTTALSAMVK